MWTARQVETNQVYLLKGSKFIIGRSIECDIVFDGDKSISRSHAEINIDPNNHSLSISDLGSKFG